MIVRIRRLPVGPRLLTVIALLGLSLALGVVFATAQSGANAMAWWWPAAGIGAVAALCAPRDQAGWVIGVAALLTGAASTLAGRPAVVIVAGVVGTVIEMAVVVWGLSRRGDPLPQLQSTRDVGRLLLVMTLAAAAIGLLSGAAASVVGGDFFARLVAVTASHLSALLLLVPLALVPLPRVSGVILGRAVILAVAVFGSVFVAFGPWLMAPLAFLPVPLLAWAAFSASTLAALAHVLLAVTTAGVLTAVGWGPFAHQTGVITTGALLQIYAIAIGVTCLLISAERSERRRLQDRHQAFTLLLRDSFERSRNGVVIVQESAPGSWGVWEINAAAVSLLDPDFRPDEQGRWQLDPRSRLSTRLSEVGDVASRFDGDELGEGRPPTSISVEPVRNDELGRVLLLSVEDLRPVREAEAAMREQLDRERRISEALRALNDQQDAFVASVSHELRTPITSIVGYAQELEFELEDPHLREYAEVITRNADRLTGLVDNVLRAATMPSSTASGGVAVEMDLADLVTRCVADLRYRTAERSLQTVVRAEPGIVVRVDEAELARVLTNLLTNAIKFSPVGAAIDVEVSTDADAAVVRIADEGPGIPEGDRERIFERFYRSPQAVRDGIPGTGIGLSIAQQLMVTMGGSILLEPRQPHGTVAVVRLPLAEA